MTEAHYQDLGEKIAECVFPFLARVGEPEAQRRLPAIRGALDSFARSLAEVAGEDVERAKDSARYGLQVRGAELGYWGSDTPRTLGEAARRRRLREIVALLDAVAPNTAERYVESVGAEPEAVARRCGRIWVLRGSHEVLRDFTEDEPAASFAVVEILDGDAEFLLGFAAWRVDRPAEFWSFATEAAVLGLANIEHATEQPLRIHKTPAAWLAANCEGVVVLSDRAGRDIARAPGWLAAEDQEQARQIARLIAPFADPRKIVVRTA